MTPEELVEIISGMIQENSHNATGLFIIQTKSRTLNLALNNGVIEFSDPKNANYQNVAIVESELISYLDGYFAEEATEEGSVLRTPLIRTLEYIVAIAAILALGLTIRFVVQHLEDSSQFFPLPETVEIKDLKESRSLMVKHAGVYATRLDDGEMLLELTPDGTWAFFDVEKGAVGSFILSNLNEGQFRPVYESGRVAILTDARYIFYPESTESELMFLQRRFKRLGNSRDDLPFVAFPDKGTDSLASL